MTLIRSPRPKGPGLHLTATLTPSTRDAALATVAYAALTLALTWPLVLGLTRDVPSDLGDPLLNTWILAWDAEHLLRALTGHVAALREYWSGNIYYPHPLALAYSEHLTPQAIQILPVYALTRNPVLAYNVLLLSTFVLSGLGMFLFARELTGRRDAAFIAGLAYAYAPYRFSSIPHVQVLSSAWMPFVLYGFRRFFETRRTRPLVGAVVAWIVQNLSCGYYLLYFSPVVALYVAWEITTRGAWRDARTLWRIAVAVLAASVATLPFLIPYMSLRALGFSPRSLSETDRFSADVYAYLTADPSLRFWGPIATALPKAEGHLFPGLTIFVLAVIAIAGSVRLEPDATVRPDEGNVRGKRYVTSVRIIRRLLAAASVVLVAMLFGWTLRTPILKITSFDRVAVVVAVLSMALLILSPAARAASRRWLSSTVGLLTVLTCFAFVMSFGPHIYADGKLVEASNIYSAFYNFVPGFDGLRVPARFAMIVALGLAALAGYGANIVARDVGKRAIWIAAALIVAESIAIPIGMNASDTSFRHSGLAPLPDWRQSAFPSPPIYERVETLPQRSVLIELPLGEPAMDVRYMFFSTRHWRPLVNGYSGGSPIEYGLLTEFLSDALRRPDRAWNALEQSQATHALVHEAFYDGTRGAEISDWLRRYGAREIASAGSDRLFELRHSF